MKVCQNVMSSFCTPQAINCRLFCLCYILSVTLSLNPTCSRGSSPTARWECTGAKSAGCPWPLSLWVPSSFSFHLPASQCCTFPHHFQLLLCLTLCLSSRCKTTYKGKSSFQTYSDFLQWENFIQEQLASLPRSSALQRGFQTCEHWKQIFMEIIGEWDCMSERCWFLFVSANWKYKSDDILLL